MKKRDHGLLDSQKYSECQLVSVLNAAVLLGERPVDPDSEEYERLVDLVGARHGSAVSIHEAVRYMRLVRHEITPVELGEVRTRVMSGHPASVMVWHSAVGFHDVLLSHGKAGDVRVWNLRRKGFPFDRLAWERLGEMMGAVASHVRRAAWYELDPLRRKQASS